MASNTLTGWTNKFLQKLNTLTSQDKIDARTLIDAASHTDTQTALGNKQPLNTGLTAYADAAGATEEDKKAPRRALIGAASDDSPNFNSPTALTAAEGNRSSLLATTEFVWDGGPLKAIPPDGINAGSLLAQYNNTVAAATLGFGAVDLQSEREISSETATGNYSFIAGGRLNTASGRYTFVTGISNTASGEASCVHGTSCTASGVYSYAEGFSTTASGLSSHAEGRLTAASGDYSHAQGESTTASAYGSHAEGQLSVASGVNSHAEGEYTTASGRYSHVGGGYNTASIQGQVAYGGASENTQHSRLDVYKETADATPTILGIEVPFNPDAKLTIRSGWSMAGTINILGIKTTDGSKAAHFIRKFSIKNVGGVVSLNGTVTTIGTDEADVGMAVAVDKNDSTDSLDITVTGLAATTIRWAAVVDAVEVKLT
jgi:hypothetical protein